MSVDAIPSLADLFAIPSEVTWKGEAVKLPVMTELHRAMFSRWLSDRAMDVVANSATLSDAERKDLLRGIATEAACGKYDWGGLPALSSYTSPSGFGKVMHILLEGRVTELEAREIGEANFERVFARVLAEIQQSPKVLAAVRSALDPSAAFSPGSSSTRRSTSRKKKSRR